MKSFLLLALLAISPAYATTLNPTPCSAAGVCQNPAPGITAISFSPYNLAVSATVNGKTYNNQAVFEIAPTFAINTVLYASDGSQVTLSAAFQHWVTRTSSGRGQMIVQHYSLLGGTLD